MPLVLSLVVVSGIVFANRETKNETVKKLTPKPISAAERKAALKQWYTTPGGIAYKNWEASPAGKKVYSAEAKIRHCINESSNMEAVVISLSLPPGSRLGFGVMVRINGEDYILTFPAENDDELQQLRGLKVGDKISIKSRSVSHAPKHAYPIIACEYAEQDNKLIYKRVPPKDGC